MTLLKIHPHVHRMVGRRARFAISAGAVSLASLFFVAVPIPAQTMAPRSRIAGTQNKPSAELPATPEAAATMPAPLPLIQQPPSQAVIQTTGGKLRIEASNASLSQTLQRISATTGMTVDGVTGDERVFGTFGPGEPKDVLTTLLDGTAYNIIMVGTLTDGAPRELLLSPKDKAGAGSGTGSVQQAAPQPASDDDSPQDQPAEDPPPVAPPPGRPMAPGPGGQMQPRSPQELLHQLREQQMQQQQGPQQ